MTIDGFVASTDGSLDWQSDHWDDESCDSLCGLLSEADTLLLGRNTYAAFAGYWPSRIEEQTIARGDLALAEVMNSYKKVVVSSTIARTDWRNSTMVNGDLSSVLNQLKDRRGKDIIVLGSQQLVQSLTKMRLIDRYELWIHPVALGSGTRLFDKSSGFMATKHSVLKSGVVRITLE